MGKFEVSFSVSRLYKVIVEANDKEEARNLVETDQIEYDENDYVSSAFLGTNKVTDVTHGTENNVGETKDSREGSGS